jgi:UDP-2-acetamido-3-amino-2,3-dideoxy-glucuronate N-acetyltransferase
MAPNPPDYRFVARPSWHSTCRVYAQTSVDPSVHIGADSCIWRYTTILAETRIGAQCVIADCVSIGARVTIGDGCRIQHGTAISDGTQIGAYVFIGSNVSLADCRYPQLRHKDQEVHEPPVIEDDVMIGCGAQILPGVVIHAGAQVGAGAVVTRDVRAGDVVVGNPARSLVKAPRRLVLLNEQGDVADG